MFGLIVVLLDVACPDIFPTPTPLVFPPTTLGVAAASIYTCVYRWFFSNFFVVSSSGDVYVSTHFYI